MPRKDAGLPDAWFRLARADLRTASALLEADEITCVGFPLQQGAEKGVKGFWPKARPRPASTTWTSFSTSPSPPPRTLNAIASFAPS